MNLFRRFLRSEGKSAIGGDGTTSAGLRSQDEVFSVTPMRALEISTVLACVRTIAQGVAQVPFRLYRSDGKHRLPVSAKDHPLARMLSRKPNGWMTSFELRETLMYHVLLTGNAYVWINRAGGKIYELIALQPDQTEAEFDKANMAMRYRTTLPNGAQKLLDQTEVWHLRGPSYDAQLGLNIIRLARSVMQLTMAVEKSQLDTQKSGAQPGGIYSIDGNLTKEQFEGLRAWLMKFQPGQELAGQTMILDRGGKFQTAKMTSADAQVMETRKFQIEEVCRQFGVMPIMVGHADKTATYASAEQMFLAHVVHTLSPWYQRIEQSADAALLTDDEQDQGLYTKFTANALMRGAAKDRGDFYAKALGSGGTKGWMSQNEVRELEELNPSDDPDADKLPQPTNAAPGAQPVTERQDGQD
ncbi:phage portal protein [Rhodobacter sp. 24-YEA-8]|uniref:phage portal protein n=1 Tax=Rhodobacter sp. 24-YEA-8 TaxID=1884310 RepID=UPI000897911D|nr:phage portal protein [Rhodobacter sp. 24-YEA-8]SEB79052.1 phage portal protein, HK97 family [Rhodobacter sp. 24-YEA-8]